LGIKELKRNGLSLPYFFDVVGFSEFLMHSEHNSKSQIDDSTNKPTLYRMELMNSALKNISSPEV